MEHKQSKLHIGDYSVSSIHYPRAFLWNNSIMEELNRKQTQGSLVYQGLSFTDYHRLFKLNGELFRGVPSIRYQFCRDLFNKGIMRELITKKLFVETEITSLKFDPYKIVLKHRTIPFVSYPQEWCDLMLKDAALHQLDFCIELDRHKLLCEDAHPLNILFDGCQPVFVDFGSMSPIPDDCTHWEWFNYEQFSRAFIYPLRLMAQGYGRIAHWLLHDYEHSVLKSDFEALTRRSLPGLNLARKLASRFKYSARLHTPEKIRNILEKFFFTRKPQLPDSFNILQARCDFLKQIRQEVENIKLPSTQPKIIKRSDGLLLPELTSEKGTSSHRIVSTVLSDLRPGSVLDIGRGSHQIDTPLLAARYQSKVVAVNPDETNARNLYVVAKKNKLPIIPLQINFFSPSYDLSNYWFKPASERLRCDLVIALDLVEHLIKENLRFDLIAERLSVLSKRWLLVDFTPDNDWESPETRALQNSGYTIDSLIDELIKRFRSVNKISSQSEHPVLLLCEK
ncbi:hypothetical protein QUF90_16255 [Desulfococcaceae bacterium HSG9]|nr:hypothetical protein [Desulfococcaceae bacterium HSG9]